MGWLHKVLAGVEEILQKTQMHIKMLELNRRSNGYRNHDFVFQTLDMCMFRFYVIRSDAGGALPRWHRNRSTPWQVPAEAPVLAVRGWFRMSSK